MTLRSRLTYSLSVLVLAFGLSAGQEASAGKIVLNGSDAWELHGDAVYGTELATYLGGGPIAFINNFGVAGAVVYNGVAVTGFSSVAAAAGSLGGFSTIAFASPGSCCSDPASAASLGISTDAATIIGFMAGGGNLYIQDFAGLAAWTPILGFDAAPGMLLGAGGVSGADGGISTAAGLAAGFVSDPYITGAFAHQWYDIPFFAGHGYTSFINGSSGPSTGHSFLLALDTGATVPEPETLVIVALGLVGMRLTRRKKA